MNPRSHAPIQHVSHTFVSYEALPSSELYYCTHIGTYWFPPLSPHVQLQTPLTAVQLLMCVNALLQPPVMCDCIPICGCNPQQTQVNSCIICLARFISSLGTSFKDRNTINYKNAWYMVHTVLVCTLFMYNVAQLSQQSYYSTYTHIKHTHTHSQCMYTNIILLIMVCMYVYAYNLHTYVLIYVLSRTINFHYNWCGVKCGMQIK